MVCPLYFVFLFFFGITWCICCEDYGFYLVGGLILLLMYHHLFLRSHIPLVLLLLQFCVFYPCLDENFWGVYAYASYAAIYGFGNMHT